MLIAGLKQTGFCLLKKPNQFENIKSGSVQLSSLNGIFSMSPALTNSFQPFLVDVVESSRMIKCLRTGTMF